jgi:hypothetical protein
MNCRRVIWTLLVAILFAPGASCGLLDDGVNFAADKNRYACHVKPQHQNDDRRQGRIKVFS